MDKNNTWRARLNSEIENSFLENNIPASNPNKNEQKGSNWGGEGVAEKNPSEYRSKIAPPIIVNSGNRHCLFSKQTDGLVMANIENGPRQ